MVIINYLSALRAEPATVLFILVVADKWGNSTNKQNKFQNNCKKVMADKWANAKSDQQSIQKLTQIIENEVWDHPGGSWGRLGDQFGPRAAQGSKRAPKRCEILVRFWHRNGDPVQLLVFFLFCVF